MTPRNRSSLRRVSSVSHRFFVASPDGADNETAGKANAKLADIQNKLRQVGADFATIAKTDSDERVSGERGGEIGWLAEAQMLPEIKGTVVGLAKGMYSAPVHAKDGWHILKVLDTSRRRRWPWRTSMTPYSSVFGRRKPRPIGAHISPSCSSKAPPTINELALSQVLDQARADAQLPSATTPR